MTGVRKTRLTTAVSTPPVTVAGSLADSITLDDLRVHIHSPQQFIDVYNQCYQITTLRSLLIETLCHVLSSSADVDIKVLLFILDSCIEHHADLLPNLTDEQFKQDLIPFIKSNLSNNEAQNDLVLSILRFMIVLVEYYTNLLNSTLTEWLSITLHFVVTRITSSSYLIYGDLVIDLLAKTAKQLTPLPKETVDVLGRSSSSIISTSFLTELKLWVKHVDDIKLALFAIHLWEPLAALLSRLLTRGHTKGNEMLAVMQDAFVVANYPIRAAAFSAWASFMSHIYRTDLNLHNDDVHQLQLYNRLLKLFVTPFLPDYTSKSKSTSIAKCRAWLVLVSAYPTHIDDVLIPFLSFAFGTHISLKTTTTWWIECRKIGAQCLYDILTDTNTIESIIKTAGDQILQFLFDSIVFELGENVVNEDKLSGISHLGSYLMNLKKIYLAQNCISDNLREAINLRLLTCIEQLWIDSHISTRFLIKLFSVFEKTAFPLAIETVPRDFSTRTMPLSTAPENVSHEKPSTSNQSSCYNRTTLSDQYLHIMLNHTGRFNNDDNDPTVDESYLHVLSYLIDTLSKTSDDNFCHQTNSLLIKCSDRFSNEPRKISILFWYIWFRCSTHLTNILNRTRSIEPNDQQQTTTFDLLIRPFEFGDCKHIDFSFASTWTQLFKALCRLAVLDGKPLINIYSELFRQESVFQHAIKDSQHQRLFGFLLTVLKCLLKTFADADLSTIPKRSSSTIVQCFTQFSLIIDFALERLLLENNNYTQWLLVCYCLLKSNKINSNEQAKSIVFTHVRDLIVDLFSLCKTCSQLEIILSHLTKILPYLNAYEQNIVTTSSVNSSPVSINKQQQTDNVLLNKIISTVSAVFESSNGSSLLELLYPVLITAFQHNKAIIRNKTRKCWNETFGRLKFIAYPDTLRSCLRDLKDKEHLLLPCFLADQEGSHTADSDLLLISADESQQSQPIDIMTPLIPLSRTLPPMSPATSHSSRLAKTSERTELKRNLNDDSQSDVPVVIARRMPSSTTALTEKQKEKLRTREAIPILLDDNSNTQSLSSTMDTPTIENMMANYQLRSNNSSAETLVFKESIANTSTECSHETNTTVETSSTIEENENSPDENNDDDIPEESSIARKIRRSRRASTSARKSLLNNTAKKHALESLNEVTTITVEPSLPDGEATKTRTLKSILKRLSPTRPRQDHTRRVAFHDQVKVLLFASPARREPSAQQPKKKSPARDDNRPVSTITTRRSHLANNNNNNAQSNQNNDNVPKTRSSKLLNFSNDATKSQPTSKSNEIIQLRSKKPIEPIYPALVDCDKPLDSLIHVVYGGACPTNAINYFRSIKMNTVGDIARSTIDQIEVYPIPPPKLANIQKALSLYQERLVNSPSLSPIIGTNGESLTPIASTSEELIAISDGTFVKEASSLPTAAISDPRHSLYDVDTLIDSIDYERLYINDNTAPTSTNEFDFIRTRLRTALTNREELLSPQKRRLSISNQDDEENNDNHEEEENTPKKQVTHHQTLGERLQIAADTYKQNGHLPFDDDYIELVRHLFNNPSLTHLEQLHLKSLFLDN